jgi:hypothetical protein
MKTMWLHSRVNMATSPTSPHPRRTETRVLAAHGEWVVPPEGRPAGWQQLELGDYEAKDRPAATEDRP